MGSILQSKTPAEHIRRTEVGCNVCRVKSTKKSKTAAKQVDRSHLLIEYQNLYTITKWSLLPRIQKQRQSGLSQKFTVIGITSINFAAPDTLMVKTPACFRMYSSVIFNPKARSTYVKHSKQHSWKLKSCPSSEKQLTKERVRLPQRIGKPLSSASALRLLATIIWKRKKGSGGGGGRQK